MEKLAILGGEPVRRKPFMSWPQFSPADVERVTEVVKSGHWGGFPVPSRYAGEFADRFAAMHGAKYGLCVTNGTIAIIAALQAAGLRFGDEVIVPAYTWDGTATAVLFAGGVPVFVDVDPDTYCLDVNRTAEAITTRTRAIIPVHLAMRFADMNALLQLAAQRGLAVIEDCAHAHGGEFQGRGAGGAGAAGCFSFQESKLMTAGEGGIVVTSRLDIYEALQSIVNCGRASLTDRYGIRMLGSNYRITELQAALLIGQFDILRNFAPRRALHADLLTRELETIPCIRPLPPQPGITRGTIYNYVLQYRPEGRAPSRDLFVAALDAEGIPCDGRFYEPVYRSDLFYATPENCPQLTHGRERPMDYATVSCTVSERAAYQEAIWLPQFLLVGDEDDVRDIAAAFRKVASNLGVLAGADPALAGVKALGRAQRARAERSKNY